MNAPLPLHSELVNFLLDDSPEDRILSENPYSLEDPVHWPTVVKILVHGEKKAKKE